MNLLLKYKDKIVSFGLLPIIITLIGIHFFPTTAMLGTGLAISIAGLLYDVLRLKGLNFFLLQGTIGIGICFLLRLFTGYDYIPKNSLTPSLEFMLLICAFIHVTAPEIYRNFLRKFHLNFTSSYLLEAKIIVIFSSIHLIILFFLYNKLIPFSPENNFGIIYLIPTLIYVICLVINIEVAKDSQTPIAPLIFISLIENAFKHGISPTEPNKKDIMLTEKDDEIHCVIRNSNYPKNSMDKSGSGIGLEQVRKRLELLYAGRYEWHQQISSNQKEYSSILTIKIPDNNKKILP